VELEAKVTEQGVRLGRYLFLGPSDAGKTTIAGHFVRDILQWPTACIRSVAPPTKPNLSRTVRSPHIPVSTEDRDAQEAAFGRIWREGSSAYDEGGSDIGFILDDADFYFSQSGRTYGADSLAKIVKLGREAGISQVFVAQGSSTTVKDLLNNASLLFIGCTAEPNLTDYARRYMRDVPDADYTISHLDKYVFLIYAPTETVKLKGLAKVVNGRIEVKPWLTEAEAPSDEESPTTDESTEATSPDDAASTPDAARSSPTDTSPDSAGSTSSNGESTATTSGKPEPGTE
jgi:hypothetical protein